MPIYIEKGTIDLPLILEEKVNYKWINYLVAKSETQQLLGTENNSSYRH